MDNTGVNGHKATDPAGRIFSELIAYALQLESAEGKGHREFSALRPGLYDGVSGLALFFAAYYRATRDAQAHKVALKALASVREKIQQLVANPGLRRSGSLAVGGLVGMGSLLYALTTTADWLNVPELLGTASDLAGMIAPEWIRADTSLDVINGCAGTLLAILAFSRVARTQGINAQSAVDLATECGHHLLRSRVKASNGLRAWPGPRGIPCAGFAHGVTGIAYALSRLFEQANEEKFREAAFEGLAFERTLYVPEQQGWLDTHSNRITERGSWCCGAPGIALGRLGCLAALDEPAVRRDLEEALRITLALPEAANDQLCCGNFGNIDILHTAGSALGRLRLSDQALECSRKIVQRSQLHGFIFMPPSHYNGDSQAYQYNPSLFLGMAGVGYTLLRLNHPDVFPSVLLLETQQ
ncbi:MAG TPA: lanthionine synthetase LanC family protein [Candidatus Angelobacter sp.]|jgi:lantibiotic modifying enzyme|nr:lanthionine synthetase LanC family protein [Candidatus Angelobacter sp.]